MTTLATWRLLITFQANFRLNIFAVVIEIY